MHYLSNIKKLKIEQAPGQGDYEELQKERKGATIGQYLNDRAPEEIPGTGSCKEKSHFDEVRSFILIIWY